jgi:hypothetical protein
VLVDEDDRRVLLERDRRQLAQRLTHEPRLQSHVRVAHFAFDLRLGRQRRHRIDDDQIHPARADELIGDLQRLLAVVGLRDQQILQLHAQPPRILRIERVLGVDERAVATQLLRLRDRMQRQRRLARRLRSEDLDDPTARQPADAQRDIE